MVLLVAPGLVVEGEEEGFSVQRGVHGGRVAGRHAPRELAHAWRHMLPLPVLLRPCELSALIVL